MRWVNFIMLVALIVFAVFLQNRYERACRELNMLKTATAELIAESGQVTSVPYHELPAGCYVMQISVDTKLGLVLLAPAGASYEYIYVYDVPTPLAENWLPREARTLSPERSKRKI